MATRPVHRPVPTQVFADQLLTVPQTADRLGVSVRKLWRLLAAKEFKHVRIGRRGTRVAESELMRFMASLRGRP